MKKYLYTTAILVVATVMAKAQPQPEHMPATNGSMNDTAFHAMPYFTKSPVKYDTVKQWIRAIEVPESNDSETVWVNDTRRITRLAQPREIWIDGYAIKGEIFLRYLYNDRKTPITNKIIYSIDR